MAFVSERDNLLKDGKVFFSVVDEKSFGKHGKPVQGHAPKGCPLFMKNNITRVITMSALVQWGGGPMQSYVKQGSFDKHFLFGGAAAV